MNNKLAKILVFALFILLFIGSAVWMYNKFVVPNSPYNKEVRLRGTGNG